MIFNIGIFSIALLSVIPYGSGYFTYGNFPVHTTYFPSFAYPRTFVAPSWTTLPAATGYGGGGRVGGFGENTGFQVGFSVKEKDLCANQGILRTRAGPSQKKSPFFLPKLPSLRRRPASRPYTDLKSQGYSTWTDAEAHKEFTRFDADGSGTMTHQEFIKNFQYWEELGGGHKIGQTLLEEELAALFLFYLADDNSSGTLSKNEYRTFTKKLFTKKDSESVEDLFVEAKIYKAMFYAIDEDKNGSVLIDELNKIMITKGYVLTVYELQQLMQSMDANEDGGINNNEISKMMGSRCLEPQTYLAGPPRPAGNPH